MSFQPDRRALLAGALALAACNGRAQPTAPRGAAPALKSVAPFPVGAAVYPEGLVEPDYLALVLRHLDQVTAENAMKMGAILTADGGFDFNEADLVAGFAQDNGLRLFGHTLIWYSEEPASFARILGDRRAFERAYRNYISAVVGRYRGQVAGWDVVNEPVTEAGEGLRDCYWMQAFGPSYIDRAFHLAREADPEAVLFLNEYDLEKPVKRRALLRLAETLLKRGVPLGGIGTQAHLNLRVTPADAAASIRELASLGLPIHVSELDVWTDGPPGQRLEAQARLFGAMAEAFAALPESQRFAFSTWGLRDSDSWRKREDAEQEPLLLDDHGVAKPAFWAAVEAWS